MISITDYYRFGQTIFGPFLYGFTAWLRKNLEADSMEKIFFFSRDGFMMQKAYEAMDADNPLGMPHEYVYFSRNSLRRALLWKCETYGESLKYLSKQRFTAFSEIASYYGVNRSEVEPLLDEVGLAWKENLLQEHLQYNDKVKRVYDHFKLRIDDRSRNQYEELVAYLEQIGMKGRCAIVDIGWHGTMQYYLELLLAMSGLNADVTGYYVGVNPIVPLAGEAKGYLFQKGNLKYRKPLLCFLGGIEKLFQSLEGSTDGYESREGRIVPVLKAYEYADDDLMKEYVAELQRGGLDYIVGMREKQLADGSNASLYMPLIRFGMYPSLSQTKLFRFFYTTDGEKLYFLPQKSVLRYKPKEFLLALSNSMWKTGFMREAFKVPLPYYWIYKWMRK